MTDYTELKRLAERVIEIEARDGDEPIAEAWDEFEAVATPSAVLALIAENERLERKNANQSESIREYQDLVMGGDVSLGMLKADIRVTTAERDELRAEIAGLKTGYEAYERVNAELKAENEALRKDLESHKRMLLSAAVSFGALGEALGGEMDDDASELEGLALELRKDAERYRAIRDDIPHVDLGRAIVSANDAAEYDAAIDAAMGKGEQS